MMYHLKSLVITTVLAATCMLQAQEAQAGPLLDWLRGIRRPGCARNNAPQYGYYAQAPNAQAVAPNAAGLQPGQCMKTCNQTCSRTVVNYVPYTAYRTNWNKVPVTQYRPVTSSDPCTGCTMTCMKPCTTYTYQMQRVPYTTYRPVYRQEQYTVPVTTITNDCATGNCGGTCDTCGTAPAFGAAPQNYAPTPSTPTYSAPAYDGGSVPAADTTPSISMPSGSQSRLPVPSSTISTGNTYQVQSTQYPSSRMPTNGPMNASSTPHTASAPDIRSATQGVRPPVRQRSFLDRLENQGSDAGRSTSVTKQADQRNNIRPTTNLKPLRRRWSYSPVRMASNDMNAGIAPAKFSSVARPKPVDRQSINDAWEDVR